MCGAFGRDSPKVSDTSDRPDVTNSAKTPQHWFVDPAFSFQAFDGMIPHISADVACSVLCQPAQPAELNYRVDCFMF